MQLTTVLLFVCSLLASVIFADDSAAERLQQQQGDDFPQEDEGSFLRNYRSGAGVASQGKPSFIRFGKRAQPSFIRFGKRAQPSFIRFGRSSSDQY